MSCSGAAVNPSGQPLKADWNKAAEGISLAGYAVFFLLNTTGVVPWSFWLDAIPLWPLLIMSWGIKIAFERTRFPWLVMLGPAIVLSGLAWVASGAKADIPDGDWKSEGPLPRPEGAQRVELDLRMLASRLRVEARELEAGAIADARSIERGEDRKLQVSREGDSARLRIESGKKGFAVLPGRRQRWDLGVPTDLPIELELQGAMVRSTFDLSKGTVAKGDVNGVFLISHLSLPATDQPVKIHMRGVFNVLRIEVPKGTTVKLTGTGFPFNLMKRRVIGDASKPGYEVNVDSIFCAVAVDTRSGKKADEPATPEASPSASPDAERPKPEAEPTPDASPAPVRG